MINRNSSSNKFDVSIMHPVDLSELWYGLDVVPEEGRRILATTKSGYAVCWYIDDVTKWRMLMREYGVYCWAYVSDLLPNYIKKEMLKFKDNEVSRK